MGEDVDLDGDLRAEKNAAGIVELKNVGDEAGFFRCDEHHLEGTLRARRDGCAAVDFSNCGKRLRRVGMERDCAERIGADEIQGIARSCGPGRRSGILERPAFGEHGAREHWGAIRDGLRN